MVISKCFSIYGRVQGVGFRYFTWKQANKMGIKGWVKNLSDGSVRILAQGTDENMQRFKQWLEQGPPTATVNNIVEQEYMATSYSDFVILHSNDNTLF